MSPGVARGRAIWIRSLEDLHKFEPGAILLASYLDPSFSMVLESSAGAALVHGGLLSHGAIIAREYGLPAVVGVTGLTQIQDGETIEVDGNTGTVVRCND